MLNIDFTKHQIKIHRCPLRGPKFQLFFLTWSCRYRVFISLGPFCVFWRASYSLAKDQKDRVVGLGFRPDPGNRRLMSPREGGRVGLACKRIKLITFRKEE